MIIFSQYIYWQYEGWFSLLRKRSSHYGVSHWLPLMANRFYAVFRYYRSELKGLHFASFTCFTPMYHETRWRRRRASVTLEKETRWLGGAILVIFTYVKKSAIAASCARALLSLILLPITPEVMLPSAIHDVVDYDARRRHSRVSLTHLPLHQHIVSLKRWELIW